MTCAEITELLPEYVRRRLPAEQEAAIRRHLSACPACAAAYEDELAFRAAIGATDVPAPPQVLARVMIGVHAEPRQAPVFRVRPLDFVLAALLATALAGLFVAFISLKAIGPAVTGGIDFGALLDGDVTMQTLVLAALWATVGLTITVPVAVAIRAATMRTRRGVHHLGGGGL